MITFAIDRASARRVDQDGRLHVELTNISKATVNPYYGREIPGAAELGLDPETVYQVFRDPGALAEACETFNNIPLMDDHIIVSADDPAHGRVVGSTGTDCTFDGEYLRNSLVVWDAAAIARIESGEQKEISCAYRYVATLKSGTYKGLPYTLVMGNIVGNHVALVKEGRAGPDVVVADSKLGGDKMKFSAIKGKLAAKFACDTALSSPDRMALMLALDEMDDDDKDCTEDEAEEEAKAKAADAKKGAKDEDPEPPAAEDSDDDNKPAEDSDDDEDGAPAMDAASVKRITDAAIATYAKGRDALDAAKLDVAPIVGTVHGLDNAAAVYRFALDAAHVDHAGVRETAALRALVKMVPRADAAAPRIALDSKTRDNVVALIPGLSRYA